MQQFNIKGSLTQRQVNQINSLNTDVLLIMQNTKGQDSSILSRFNHNVQIRIIGGLDESKKPKYNSKKYYDRTIYSPMEVSRIISKFEKIEEGIQDNWSDLEKAVYVYDKLADRIAYGEVINQQVGKEPRDLGRTLNIMNTEKGVCAGYALAYKEAMDRLGIECEYINKPHTHAWNAITVNGVYYPVDLTWDAHYRQTTQNQDLRYFARDPSFTQHPAHQADHSDMQVPSNCLPQHEINNALNKVRGKEKENKTWRINRGDKTSCLMSQLGKTDEGLFIYAHSELDSTNQAGQVNMLFSELDLSSIQNAPEEQKSLVRNQLLSKERISTKLKESNGYVGTCQLINNEYRKVVYRGTKVPMQASYMRQDGTSFALIPSSKEQKNGVFTYQYAEFDQKNKCKTHIIYSEDDLIKDVDYTKKAGIANLLLSKDRVDQKVRDVGGYVGFLKQHGNEYRKYYNPDQEKKIANYVR